MAPVDRLVRIGTGRDAKDVAFSTIFGAVEMTRMELNVLEHEPRRTAEQRQGRGGAGGGGVGLSGCRSSAALAQIRRHGGCLCRKLRLPGRFNGPTVHDEAQMPFGGVKGSGMGRFGGKAGIAEFTDLRWITIQTTPRHYPF